ncbi:sensor histidine kinase [Niabella sp. 22666]|uniref:sensor histidine kinase n=1 Tax=Niabella sp. 22666 TaxID=3453954 RepID=UPI003F84F57B
MKRSVMKYICLLSLLMTFLMLPAQQQDFTRIGPFHLQHNEENLKSLPYLKYDGKSIIDKRSASAQEKANVNLYEKLITIDHEKKWYEASWSLGDPSRSVVASFENNRDEIYVSEIKGRGFLVNGTAFAEFANVLVDATNAQNYLYHVIKDDREEIVPWKKPDQFIKTSDGRHAYAYLGKFYGSPGQQVKIEMYNIRNYADRSSMLVEWVEIKTPSINGFIEYKTKSFAGILGTPFSGVYQPYNKNKYTGKIDTIRYPGFIDTFSIHHSVVKSSDSLLNLNIHVNNNPALSASVYLVKKQGESEERIFLGGRYNKTIYINRELWKEPGEYKIEFIPYAIVKRSDRANKTGMYEHEFTDKKFVYDLTVLPDKNQSLKISISAIIFTAVALILLGLFLLILSRYRNRLKFEKVQRRGEQAQSQLQSIRSQLNPHFIFNALSGIQTLMNKNEVDTANEYLSKFARLTRRVLDDAGKEQVSLADEAALLDDYLKMEQLRFGFQYNITIDEQLSEDLQIPVMLLQPLVENAVKHGIVNKKKNGLIKVSFSKAGEDLILKVKDNGEGFDKENLVHGKGLELTQNRVSLSNTIYKNTPLNFNIEPTTAGTTATIILKNWLS